MYQNVVIYILCSHDFVFQDLCSATHHKLDQQQQAHYANILTNYHKLEPDQLKKNVVSCYAVLTFKTQIKR
jgi:hypothetical protein